MHKPSFRRSRINRICRIGLLAALGLCFFLGQAFANSTVNLTFLNVGPGNVAGGDYAYPYNLSINGSSTLTSMMCDGYNNHIDFRESWTADVHGLLQGGMFGTSGPALLDYKAAGLIFLSVLNGNVNGSLGNEAVWALFNGQILGSNDAAVQALLGEYLGLAANAPTALSGAWKFTPRSDRGPVMDRRSSSATRLYRSPGHSPCWVPAYSAWLA